MSLRYTKHSSELLLCWVNAGNLIFIYKQTKFIVEGLPIASRLQLLIFPGTIHNESGASTEFGQRSPCILDLKGSKQDISRRNQREPAGFVKKNVALETI